MNQRLDDERQRRWDLLRTIAIVAMALIALVAGLYFASELLVPIAFAFVLNGICRPVVRWLEGYRVPTVIGASIVMLAIVALLSGIAYGLSWPIESWVREVPQRFAEAQSRLEKLRRPIEKFTAAMENVESTAKGSTTAPATIASTTEPSGSSVITTQPAQEKHPQPAQLQPQVPSMFARVLGTTTAIISSFVEVLLILYLLLASGDLFLQKLVKSIATVRDKKLAVQVVHDVENAVLRYIFVTALINAGQAVAVALSLWLIGMPNPLLWGIFTFVLEFIPYLGGTIMVGLLAIMAFASFQNIGHVLLAPASYLLITTIQNNVVSPIAYGRRFKLNPVAVLIGVLFWWFIWGIAGAFIAVPIIAAVKIICDRTESCQALGEFLGE